VKPQDRYVVVSCPKTSNIHLPSLRDGSNYVHKIKNAHPSAHHVVTTAEGDLINGTARQASIGSQKSAEFVSVGRNWYVM